MKLSPSAVGKTIGTQLRKHQDAVVANQSTIPTPSELGSAAAIMRLKISPYVNVITWSALVVRPEGGYSILQGRQPFEFLALDDTDRRYESAIKQVWPYIARGVRAATQSVTHIELDITSRRARSVIETIEPEMLVKEFPSNPLATRINDANLLRMDEALFAEHEQEALRKTSKLLMIATDASIGHGKATASYVASNGSYAGWIVKRVSAGRTRDTLTAELWAIHGALHRFRGHRGPIVLKSDSLNAVTMLNSNTPLRPRHCSGYLEEALQSIATVLDAMNCESVRFEWVRGHAGDPLNEIADDIAVLTRRHAQADIPAAESQERIRTWVKDSLAVLNLAA